jgi:hypothetical protein
MGNLEAFMLGVILATMLVGAVMTLYARKRVKETIAKYKGQERYTIKE